MRKIINNTYQFFFSIYCAVIPYTNFGEAIPNIILIILVLLFPFVIKNEDWIAVKRVSFYILLFIAVISIVQFMFFNRWEDFKFIKRIILIVLVILSSLPIKASLTPIFSFIFGAFILLILSISRLVMYYVLSGNIDMTVGEHIFSILLGERPYIGYTYVVSLCLCLYVANKNRKRKFFFYFLAAVFLIYIFIISARISLISLVIITLSYLFFAKNIKKIGLILFVFSTFCALMFTFNHSLKKRFFMSSNKYSLEQLMKFEPRYYIWNCAYIESQKSSNYFFGKGFVNVNKELENCYYGRTDFMNEEQQVFFSKSKFNTHNQFLNFYLSTGIITSFLFILFFIFWFYENKKNYYAFVMVFALFPFCFVENVLSRQMGVELFSITLVFSSIIIFRDGYNKIKAINF